jgi:ATP-dependent exoDNAse (exonuclease V) beta subunit
MSAQVDYGQRANDGVGADEHAWVNADIPPQIELLVLPSLENTEISVKTTSNMPSAGVFIVKDAIEKIANSGESLESLESRLGQAMHRLLQRADVTQVDAVALEFSLSSQEAQQAANMAKQVMAGEGAWAWDADIVDWQGNEVELSTQGKLLRLDRLVHRKDTGAWWVLDYKSESQPHNKPELVAQMRAYMAAVQACYVGEPVKAAFLTAAGKMIEIPYPSVIPA